VTVAPAVVRPFRFGVSIWGAATSAEWRRKAQRAETAGFDTLLTADHLVEGMLSPLSPLVVAAEATDQLRVGTLVLNNDFRHPVVLAREATTVDLLTDGRLELGLGAGHMKYEYDQAGLAFDAPAVRVARMTEAAEIIRRLLAHEAVTFAGDHYHVDRHRCFPSPTQPRVPLLIGGNGRRVLATAGRLADIVSFTGFSQVEGERNVNPTHFTVEGLNSQIGWVKSAAGGRSEQPELSTLVQGITIARDRRTAARDVQPLLPTLAIDDLLSSP
jgi:probable F420-dependent oxidoreductase